jgi:hypothetical protein
MGVPEGTHQKIPEATLVPLWVLLCHLSALQLTISRHLLPVPHAKMLEGYKSGSSR